MAPARRSGADLTCDVVVVGGGPAGAAAAYRAARTGLETILVDRAEFPRDKTCGDGLTASALRELESIGIDVRARDRHPAQIVREVEIVGPYGVRVLLPLEAGLAPGAIMGAVMRRVDLDAEVLERAGAGGAKVIQGGAVTAVDLHADHVAVTLETGETTQTLRARYVIGADGAHSLVRRTLYPLEGRRVAGMQAVRRYVDAPESDLISVLFIENLLPGYAWIFPLPGGGANIGLGVQRDPAVMGKVGRSAMTNAKGNVALGGLKDRFRELLRRPDVIDRIGEHDPDSGKASSVDAGGVSTSIRAWPIPADPRLNRVGVGRVLLVGDAARVVDPMTGEGIGQGLISARLAVDNIADAIAAGRPDAVVGYRRDLDRELGHDLRFARSMLAITRHRRGCEWAFEIAGLTTWTRRNVGRWLFEDYPRAQILTPGRWREHAMSGRGAYGA